MIKKFLLSALCIQSVLFGQSTVFHSNYEYLIEQNFDQIKEVFDKEECWGLYTTIDLYECDSELIKDKEYIENFVILLCMVIDMNRFGDPVIIHFGKDEKVAGYSMYQLIETSNISGHFANKTNAAYIDIFSCKLYDPYLVAEFAAEYFEARRFRMNVIFRQ